jgi:hypothetical protein
MEEQYNNERQLLVPRLASSVARRYRLAITIYSAVLLAVIVPSRVVYAENASATWPSLVAQSKVLSPADERKEISVVLVLALKDQTAAEEFARHVSTPGDPIYGQ